MGEPRTLREALTPYRGYPEPDGQGNRRWAPDPVGAYVGFEDAIDVFRALASLASSDSLRLDPEDPRLPTWQTIAAIYHEMGQSDGCGNCEAIHEDDAKVTLNVIREAIAREWKASALPDPEVTK